MTDYKATPEQWAQCEDWVRSSVVGASDACILELRARVETLEAAVHKHIVETSANILKLAGRIESLEAAERETSKVYQISNRSLVKRVALAISGIEYGSEMDEEATHWASEARAVIREVAAWLIDRKRDDDWLAPFEELADLLLEEAQR